MYLYLKNLALGKAIPLKMQFLY